MLIFSKSSIRLFIEHTAATFIVSFFKIIKLLFKDFELILIRSSRIGHQALDLEACLRRPDLYPTIDPQKSIFISDKPANIFLHQLRKRNLKIITNNVIYRLFFRYQRSNKNSDLVKQLPTHWCVKPPTEIFTNSKTQLNLTSDDNLKGEMILKKLGIPNDAEIITFSARDSKYLKNEMPGQDWSYHDFRNSNINNYAKALDRFVNKKLYAVRVGKTCEPLKHKSPYILDYSDDLRTDLGEIYLIGRSKFFLGTTSGSNATALSLNIPFIQVNSAPIGSVPFGDLGIFIPKISKLRSGEVLSISQVKDKGLLFSGLAADFDKADVELVENSVEDIANAIEEMFEILDHGIKETQNQVALRKWLSFKYEKGYKAVISEKFLNSHPSFLDIL